VIKKLINRIKKAKGALRLIKDQKKKSKVPNMPVRPPIRSMGSTPPPKPSKKGRFNVFQTIIILVILWSALLMTTPQKPQGEEKPLSEIILLIKQEKVEEIGVERDNITVMLKDGSTAASKKEEGSDFLSTLTDNGVDPTIIPGGVGFKVGVDYLNILVNFAPVLITVLFFYFLLKQTKGATGDIFSFGKSRAKMFRRDPKESNNVSFKDIAGSEEVKSELTEILDFLKNPQKYRKLGARIPKGVLLVGPAGVGKTLMARALAGEAEVPFYSVAGSEFMEMLVGVGSSRVRDLFSMAKATQPSVIFIDEVDAIGRQRGMGIGGGHDEREQTLNQILVEMDGFDPRTTIVVLAATNRPDMLDPALVRPGRFDRKIYLNLPDLEEREQIFKIHTKEKPIAKDVDPKNVAKMTVGFSGADIENMLNEAAILAARKDKKEIEKTDIREASTKVKLGPERKKLQDEEEKKITAYHEAGHAIVAAKLPNMDPVERISIVSRAMTLGHTEILASREKYNETKTRLLEFITMTLGGRAAEEIVFNEKTIGAANDIERATEIAKRMVCEFGMSSLGPIHYVSSEDSIWLARQIGKPTGYSENMAYKIDLEVIKIINDSYKKARDILIKNRKNLDKVVDELIKKETLEREEFEKIITP